jgi:hypothetical protein
LRSELDLVMTDDGMAYPPCTRTLCNGFCILVLHFRFFCLGAQPLVVIPSTNHDTGEGMRGRWIDICMYTGDGLGLGLGGNL